MFILITLPVIEQNIYLPLPVFNHQLLALFFDNDFLPVFPAEFTNVLNRERQSDALATTRAGEFADVTIRYFLPCHIK